MSSKIENIQSFKAKQISVLESNKELKFTTNIILCLLDENLIDFSIIKRISNIIALETDSNIISKFISIIVSCIQNTKQAFSNQVGLLT